VSRTALTVALSIGDLELAERVRARLAGRRGFDLADTDGRQVPEVRITDATTGFPQDAPVVVLTDAAGAVEALQAGAAAALAQDIDGSALGAAIVAAARGLTTLSAELRDHLVHGLARREAEGEDETPPLTARELQVLQLLAQGASNKAIARHLDITPHTAKFHVASIVAKLGASGRTDAVAKGMRLGLVMV
jgi:DNA-binding NarL/FixJ family response regulator